MEASCLEALLTGDLLARTSTTELAGEPDIPVWPSRQNGKAPCSTASTALRRRGDAEHSFPIAFPFAPSIIRGRVWGGCPSSNAGSGGCSSVVERHVANVGVVGSSPIT